MRRQLSGRGIEDPKVLSAMGRVPRECFVPHRLRDRAYDDSPLPIGKGQTISQPYVVAYMIEALELDGDERVLDVGTGSGYAAAVLAEIVPEVYTVERFEELAETARETLVELGYDNVRVRHGDGTKGWPEAAPFDGIVVSAGGPEIPGPLRGQLAVGGRLVMPVGRTPHAQELIRLVRAEDEEVGYREENLGAVRFVPLVGSDGWKGDEGGRGKGGFP